MNKNSSEESVDFTSLYHRAPCGLLTYAINGSVIQANKTLLEWLNITHEEIVNKTFTDLLDRGGQLYYQLFVYPMLVLQKEVKEIHLDIRSASAAFPCFFSASADSDNDGQTTLIHAIVFKVAHRKKYEDELLRKKTAAEKENQQKAQTLQEVAFYQSHLVRAPLANILGLADLLTMYNSEDDIQDIIVLLKESAAQLDTVIKKIVGKANS
ncbi:hypothetical protein F1649_00930 [Arcticibacter tournemirensis]|uniref:PAS domain-containing protein n=1 Tax=Arcticibacter tournemirensis TaxID=699437 RepID=A0A5M9HN46_9SPHI|nr:PAS domain-containing protein [Arcticibacter tournemirensis]KAA8486808.1 hypothetical protein F1649_00930 [Arcticibacter tournemirensis]